MHGVAERFSAAASSAHPRESSFPELSEARAQELRQVHQELDSLVGLQRVKRLVYELEALLRVQQERARFQLANDPLVLHQIFRGNPGTGKTTVARLLGRLFHALGALPKGQLVECSRADLVGEYIGHTAVKTREQVRKAAGGVLFIDEAYALGRGGERDFGKEAIDTLVKEMEDRRYEFVLILAGYREEMDRFLWLNPGLRSRFPLHLDFPDYTVPELMEIAETMLAQREYVLSAAARHKLRLLLEESARQQEFVFANARLVRNLVERAIRRQAVRLAAPGTSIHVAGRLASGGRRRQELMTIFPQDLTLEDAF